MEGNQDLFTSKVVIIAPYHSKTDKTDKTDM